MEFLHTPISAGMDLSACISRHSADQLVVYKHVD